MDTECIHGLITGTCSLCNPPKKTDPTWEPYRGPRSSTVAKFDGRCKNCAELIEAGTRIYKVDDVWVCDDCAT